MKRQDKDKDKDNRNETMLEHGLEENKWQSERAADKQVASLA